MESKLDYYKRRAYAFLYYELEMEEDSEENFLREKKLIDDAYEQKDERLLRALDKEMMAGINEYPLEYRRVIYKRIEAATGESAEKIEKFPAREK